jgi:hypothetical protein
MGRFHAPLSPKKKIQAKDDHPLIRFHQLRRCQSSPTTNRLPTMAYRCWCCVHRCQEADLQQRDEVAKARGKSAVPKAKEIGPSRVPSSHPYSIGRLPMSGGRRSTMTAARSNEWPRGGGGEGGGTPHLCNYLPQMPKTVPALPPLAKMDRATICITSPGCGVARLPMWGLFASSMYLGPRGTEVHTTGKA